MLQKAKSVSTSAGEAADETGTQREALCAALCGQCARQVASLARGDLSQAAQALWEAPLEELAAAQAFYQLLLLSLIHI